MARKGQNRTEQNRKENNKEPVIHGMDEERIDGKNVESVVERADGGANQIASYASCVFHG